MTTIDCRGRDALSPGEAAAVAATARRGGVLVYPTDTLYGLGADPFSPAGVAAVFRLKGRPAGKPLIVLIEAPGLAGRFAARFPAAWEELARRFWPGPLTLLFPARPGLPAGLRSAAGEVALRVPGSALCRAVLGAAGGSLTGTSANLAGERGAADAGEAARALGAGVDLVVDAGTLPPSQESTILGMDARGKVVVVRAGAVDPRALAGPGAGGRAGIPVG